MKLNTKILAFGVAASILASAGAAYAADQSVTANVDFETALSLTKTDDIEFGYVEALTAGVYTISTAGTVSASGIGDIVDDTTAQAGAITITGSTTQTLSISTGTYAPNNGVTPSAAYCSYDGGSAWTCDTPATGLTAPGAGGLDLDVGVTITADGTQAAGSTATPTFVVTVIYG